MLHPRVKKTVILFSNVLQSLLTFYGLSSVTYQAYNFDVFLLFLILLLLMFNDLRKCKVSRFLSWILVSLDFLFIIMSW